MIRYVIHICAQIKIFVGHDLNTLDTHCRCLRCQREWAHWPAPGAHWAACSLSPASSRTSRVSESECRPGKISCILFLLCPIRGKAPHWRFEIPWLSEWCCLGEACERGESSINHYWKQILWREKVREWWESEIVIIYYPISAICSPAVSWWHSRLHPQGPAPGGQPPAWPPSHWAPWGWPAASSSPPPCSPGETWTETRVSVKCHGYI